LIGRGLLFIGWCQEEEEVVVVEEVVVNRDLLES